MASKIEALRIPHARNLFGWYEASALVDGHYVMMKFTEKPTRKEAKEKLKEYASFKQIEKQYGYC
jgi:hypothetical protein